MHKQNKEIMCDLAGTSAAFSCFGSSSQTIAAHRSTRRFASKSHPFVRGVGLLQLVALGLFGSAHRHGADATPDWFDVDVPSVARRRTTTAQAQAADEENICACSPSVYRFSLDFTGLCNPPGISIGNSTGVDRYSCETNDLGEGGEINAPVVLDAYVISELDSSLEIINEVFEEGLELKDGDVIEYTSFTASGPLDYGDYPAYLTVGMKGVNANGDEVINQWTVTFTNRCDVAPFREGDALNWAVFEELDPARPELCDVIPESSIPSQVLTSSPMHDPTHLPTVEQTPYPTFQPTSAPTFQPTSAPTFMPTHLPSQIPSNLPSSFSMAPSIELSVDAPTTFHCDHHDDFGTRALYVSDPRKEDWASNAWSIDRALTSPPAAVDPSDGRAEIRNLGTIDFSGGIATFLESPSLYISKHQDSDGGWGDVEMTGYCNYGQGGVVRGDSGCNMRARTDHIKSGQGGCLAQYYSVQISRETGRAVFVKEYYHDAEHGVIRSNKIQSAVIFGEGGMPLDEWLGVKFVLYTTNQVNVKLELYVDLAGGESGGNWMLAHSFEDKPQLWNATSTMPDHCDYKDGDTILGNRQYCSLFNVGGTGTQVQWKQVTVRNILPQKVSDACEAPSSSPNDVPGSPTETPSLTPSDVPTGIPTETPSTAPRDEPSNRPSSTPSDVPSETPSNVQSLSPMANPSTTPSDEPSSRPSETPSNAPSLSPTEDPSLIPSHEPSDGPSSDPSYVPSKSPSDGPSAAPMEAPSVTPRSESPSTINSELQWTNTLLSFEGIETKMKDETVPAFEDTTKRFLKDRLDLSVTILSVAVISQELTSNTDDIARDVGGRRAAVVSRRAQEEEVRQLTVDLFIHAEVARLENTSSLQEVVAAVFESEMQAFHVELGEALPFFKDGPDKVTKPPTPVSVRERNIGIAVAVSGVAVVGIAAVVLGRRALSRRHRRQQEWRSDESDESGASDSGSSSHASSANIEPVSPYPVHTRDYMPSTTSFHSSNMSDMYSMSSLCDDNSNVGLDLEGSEDDGYGLYEIDI